MYWVSFQASWVRRCQKWTRKAWTLLSLSCSSFRLLAVYLLILFKGVNGYFGIFITSSFSVNIKDVLPGPSGIFHVLFVNLWSTYRKHKVRRRLLRQQMLLRIISLPRLFSEPSKKVTQPTATSQREKAVPARHIQWFSWRLAADGCKDRRRKRGGKWPPIPFGPGWNNLAIWTTGEHLWGRGISRGSLFWNKRAFFACKQSIAECHGAVSYQNFTNRYRPHRYWRLRQMCWNFHCCT